MLDENFNLWLIEVNSSPAMSRSTDVTGRACTMVQEDIIKGLLVYVVFSYFLEYTCFNY